MWSRRYDRRAKKVPAYCLHKASGQAIVRVDGRDVYLGPYGSPKSHEACERTLYEWRFGSVPQRRLERLPEQAAMSLTVEDLLARYFQHACVYYVTPEGKLSREFHAMRYAARGFTALYGQTLARDLGPIALKSIQTCLVEQGTLARQEINRRISRIRRILRWAVSEQLLPPAVLVAIEMVLPHRQGRTGAREAPPIGDAPLESVNAVLKVASPPSPP